jgi:hypothetical protein
MGESLDIDLRYVAVTAVITSAAPEAFYQCVCECELEATVCV